MKDFVNLSDFTGEQLRELLKRTIAEKKLFREGKLPATLLRKTLAMIFEKASLRTRVSFETAMTQLGGHAIYLTQVDIGVGKREAVQDMARVLGRICDGIMARTFSHEFVQQLAANSPVPVVNGLTDHSHPCQAMADLMTIMEHLGDPAGKTLAFVGDGNNVARSLAVGCTKLKMRFILACPDGYELPEDPVSGLAIGGDGGAFAVTRDPAGAAAEADVVYTDTWVSMGQEGEKQERLKDFAGFQINADLLAAAPADVMVMHCLPAYRGCEISDEAFESHASTILQQAENRLHFQRSLLNVLIGEGGIT